MSSQIGTPIFTPLELDRLGQRAGREDALLVEGAVIGQLVLEGAAEDLAAVGEEHGVEDLAALVDDRADQHRRPGLDRRLDQLVGAFVGAPDELGLEHQVLGRIADQLKLGTEQQVRALRPAPHLQHRRGIALEVADALVHLRKRDFQAVGHARRFSDAARFGNLYATRLAR